jgi:hypothetical protein
MKRILFAIALVLMIPLAGFSQTNGTPTPLITPAGRAETPGTVTGLVTEKSAQTITVKTEAANPISFALGKSIRYLNKNGKKIKPERIRPGARVRVSFEGNEDTRTATRITVEG